MPVITICSSASFYQKVVAVKAELEALGYQVLIPVTAQRMADNGDYDVSHYKTWYEDSADYHKKTTLMQAHFDEVAKGDAALVLNYEKHGVPNYVGGNVLMEMAVAFHLKKPIYILNPVPEESMFLEELVGLGPICLDGKPESLTGLLPV